MEICIKTQSIEVSTVTAGGSVNLGNTFNMTMGRAAPPVSPPQEEMPPEAGLPPRIPVEPGTPPEVPPEEPPGAPPGAPPGIPGELPGPSGGAEAGKAYRGRETAGNHVPSFYPLRIPDHTVVGLPFYRLT